jgi:AcrR family transcriptional regulator
MAVSTRAVDAQGRQARAERILDAAADLLLRWGYKRVTIDDVATDAGIGKGTVYLHWATREALFCSVLQRDLLSAVSEIVEAIRAEPELAIFHRLLPRWFVVVKRRPLVRAAVLAELDLLGKLAHSVDSAIECHLSEAFAQYFRLHVEKRLVRSDVPPAELMYAVRATVRGFFLADVLAPQDAQPALERRAELLSTILRAAFEPAGTSLEEAAAEMAPQVISIFNGMADHFRNELRKAYE